MLNHQSQFKLKWFIAFQLIGEQVNRKDGQNNKWIFPTRIGWDCSTLKHFFDEVETPVLS